jgi:hypothetical protein
MKLLTLFTCVHLCTVPAHACGDYGSTPPPFRLQVVLSDGSTIHAQPVNRTLPFIPDAIVGSSHLKWESIRQLERSSESPDVTISFANGDKLSGHLPGGCLPFLTSFGKIDIPYAQIKRIGEIVPTPGRINLALGKTVSGEDGASFGKGLAAHVTDGDCDTHAKPPASHFSYSIDLRDGEKTGFSVDELKIHWKEFGDRFLGIPSPDGAGWASGSWPGEYVTSYQIEYRAIGSEDWLPLHQWAGRPADETSDKVAVEKSVSKRQGASSDVTTTIQGLGLKDVSEIRISASGSHWIGVYEVEVF